MWPDARPREREEVHFDSEWDGNAAEHEEAAQDIDSPAASPTNRVTDSIRSTHQDKRGERDIQRQ